MRGIAVAAAITASLAMQAAVAWKVCETALRLPVKQLLKAIPGIGEAKARYLMRDCQIADSRRVRGLGSIQKRLLRERLG